MGMGVEVRLARIKVSKELLLSALSLPSDTKIHKIQIADDPRDIEMVVENESLPETKQGDPVPEANPLVEAVCDGRGRPRTRFLEWGLK